MAEVTELTPKTGAEDDDSPPPTPAKSKGGRPKGSQRPSDARQPVFFDRVAAVPKEDWGTRAFMYVYADEPICKPKTFGATRYVCKSSVPIYDLEGLKEDYGSFKGWISLNLRPTGKDQTAEVDRLDFEIYDPKYPPKIPRAAWTSDSRNERWIALLPPEPPPANAAASSLMEGARFYKEIRQEFKEELADAEPEAPATDQTRSTLETMKLAKELFAPSVTAAPVAPADPFDTAAKIMAMRANDPMMAVMMQLLAEANKANEASRQREYELLKQHQTAAPSKGIVDQLLEIAANAEKLEPIKKLFGFGNGATAEGAVGRAVRTTAYDVVRDIFASPFGANLGQGLGMLVANLANNGARANGAPHVTPPPVVLPPIQQGQESQEQRIQRIGEKITKPMITAFMRDDSSGESWAQSMFDLMPEDYAFMRQLGPEDIIRRYRAFPDAWNVLQFREADFIQFIQDFCKWDPNEDDGPAPPGNEDGGVTDLDSDGEVS